MSQPIDTKIISKLAEILDKNNLTELEFEDEGCRICLTRDLFGPQAPIQTIAPIMQAQQAPVATIQQASAAPSAPASVSAVDYSTHEGAVKSPMVGVIYLSPEPGAPNYIKEGDSIKAGDTLCLIEAMKTFNPVKAAKAGTITKVLVESGAPVEYGEPLVVIE